MSRVTIRRKKIVRGRETLYLDVYPPVPNPKTGRMQRKYYLRIFIYSKPSNSLERQHNLETLGLAEHIRAKYQIEVQSRRYNFIGESHLRKNFADYFKEQAEKRFGDHSCKMAVRYFVAFAGDYVPFAYLSEEPSEQYTQYLFSSLSKGRARRKIGKNTAAAYFVRLKITLKRAYKKKLILIDLASTIESITPMETRREFLQLHELEQLADAACDSDVVKKAGLFSALTGFRYSDVQALKWKDIRGVSDDHYILYSQQKTANIQYFPLSEQAVNLVGGRGEPDSLVFSGLTYSLVTKCMRQCLRNAGIDKYFTFHGFRHTYATLQIAAGTSIYTVSKLLGHKNIHTTEIYAKIVDSLKKEATGRIQLNA